MAFQSRKLDLVSFSDGGGPRELAALLKVDEDEPANWVVSELMVDAMRAEVVDAVVEAEVEALVPVIGSFLRC